MSAYLASYLAIAVSIRLLSGYLTVIEIGLLRSVGSLAIAGSVAVGKSTIARLLRELMSRWPGTPRVELVTTDGFLYTNAELERRGIMHRKGFPESYDRRALVSCARL